MKKAMAVFLAAVLFLDFVSLGVLFFTKDRNRNPEDGNKLFSRASVISVGDNLAGAEITDQAKARGGVSGYDYSFVYENLATDISEADIAILNHDSVMSEDHPVSGYPLYNSPVELGSEMSKLGFDIVNMAGNHTLDYGEQGMLNTIESWQNLKITPVGAYAKKANATNAVIRTVNGIRIAFISFTESANSNSLPEDSQAVLMLSTYEDMLYETISNAKSRADVIIAVAHWGNEYENEITSAQSDLAKKLGEWGVDIIIGSHPHVLQPIEYITNSDGSQTLVAYSLGNFVSEATKEESILGGMLYFEIVRNNESGTISIENVSLKGIVTHYGIDMSKIRLYRLSDYTNELADVHGIKDKYKEFSLKYLTGLLSERINKQFLR